MEQFLQAAALAMVGAVLAIVLQKDSRELSILLVIACSTAILLLAISFLEPLVDFVTRVRLLGNLDEGMVRILLKTAGVGLIAELAGAVCEDAGQGPLGKMVRICGSAAALYLLYCPQDPAPVYLFYRDEDMGAAQGLWYLSPALSMVNYVLVIVAVLVFSAIGFDSLMHYTQQIIREGQEDMAIERKFDVASQGASVFVHSVKNQLLANRVLLRRIGAELDKPEADMEKLREYHASLSASNAMMLERMEELYKGVKSKSIQLVPNDIVDVCAAAKERFLRKYPDANLSVSIQEDVQVFCDRTHLVESIYNLLTNGWEAQAAAGRESEPLRLLVRQERLWTAIEVRDRGNGIPVEQRKHIFEPFYSSKNSNYNWGMGLYYVRSIVKSHFGVLRLDTKVGEGSSFFILLPRYGRMADAQACRKDEI